jgi:hypothetical protein
MTKVEVATLIKDAFEEGYSSYATQAAAFNSVSEAWAESESKKVYDDITKGE